MNKPDDEEIIDWDEQRVLRRGMLMHKAFLSPDQLSRARPREEWEEQVGRERILFWGVVVFVLAAVIVLVAALAIDWTPTDENEARQVVPTSAPVRGITECDRARWRLNDLRSRDMVSGRDIDDALINVQHYCQGGP